MKVKFKSKVVAFQKLFPVKEFCKMYKVSPSTVDRYEEAGFLTKYKPTGGTKYYIDIEEFEQKYKEAFTNVSRGNVRTLVNAQ